MRSRILACRLTVVVSAVALTTSMGGLSAAAAGSPGWRIVATVGSASSQVGDGAITVSGSADAWTAWTCGPCPSGQPHANLMLHWNGQRWSPVELPADLRYPVAIAGMQASSAQNLWAFANNGNAVIFNGSRWAVRKLPSWVERPVSGNAVYIASAVFSPANVWAFSIEASKQPTLAGHYYAGSWHKVFLPVIPDLAAGLAPDDIWVYGTAKNLSSRKLAHWNGATWRTISVPHAAGGALLVASNPVPLGPKSLWMTGEVFPKSGPVTFELLHWNGHWTTTSVPASVGVVNQLASDGDGGLWLIATRTEAGGTDETRFVHYTSGHWVSDPIPTKDKLQSDPGVLATVPRSRSMWAIGFLISGSTPEFGAIMRFGR
jgi:hypothetical protein